jgi:hypothetical protein
MFHIRAIELLVVVGDQVAAILEVLVATAVLVGMSVDGRSYTSRSRGRRLVIYKLKLMLVIGVLVALMEHSSI